MGIARLTIDLVSQLLLIHNIFWFILATLLFLIYLLRPCLDLLRFFCLLYRFLLDYFFYFFLLGRSWLLLLFWFCNFLSWFWLLLFFEDLLFGGFPALGRGGGHLIFLRLLFRGFFCLARNWNLLLGGRYFILLRLFFGMRNWSLLLNVLASPGPRRRGVWGCFGLICMIWVLLRSGRTSLGSKTSGSGSLILDYLRWRGDRDFSFLTTLRLLRSS